MSENSEFIAYCHSCGQAMDVSDVAPFSNVECPICAKHTRVKREFGPYTLTRRHAAGGMSMVFVADDHTLGREVALKILSEEFSADERRISAFEEEARITASFSHPHVVQVLRTGRAFDRFYIAMELIPGGHFEHQIRTRGRIPEIEMLPLAIEIAEGLKAAHAAGLIHRDMKPGNILLDSEGHAKIVDFGLALVTQGGKAQAEELWATPYYVPPETIEGHAEDFRSDIYAFGATLYHALTGKPSCGEESMATDVLREAKKKVVPLSMAAPDLSVHICNIVERAMAYEPQARYASYDELISQLEIAVKRFQSGVKGAVESSGSAAKRRIRKKQTELITLGSVALVLLAAAGLGVWWITHEPPREEIKPPVAPPVVAVPAETAPNSAAVDIAKNYREVRAAIEARDYAKAAAGFSELLENPAVQEPSRTWAGVEAVIVRYLDGKSTDARIQAKATASHARGVAADTRIDAAALDMLELIQKLPAVPAEKLATTASGTSSIMTWMLAGLKNWEQGLQNDAVVFFAAVADAKLAKDEAWLAFYQTVARDYLADYRILCDPAFEKLPSDIAGCKSATARLDELLSQLKTQGRSRFNLRAWQLDLAKHAKLLATPLPPQAEPVSPAAPSPWDLPAVLERLAGLAADCRFAEASEYLNSLAMPAEGNARASLLTVTMASQEFLADLKSDLAKAPVAGEFMMKSGQTVKQISLNPAEELIVTDAAGESHTVDWRDCSPDALIALHRIFVKNPKSEAERVRRHQCAIAFDWLTGNRERALSAASQLAQGSDAFRQYWDEVASGLPK
jgi:serine/threonine protein kinase